MPDPIGIVRRDSIITCNVEGKRFFEFGGGFRHLEEGMGDDPQGFGGALKTACLPFFRSYLRIGDDRAAREPLAFREAG